MSRAKSGKPYTLVQVAEKLGATYIVVWRALRDAPEGTFEKFAGTYMIKEEDLPRLQQLLKERQARKPGGFHYVDSAHQNRSED